MTQYRLAGHDFGEPSVDAIDPYRALSVGDVFTATFDAATEAALIDAGLIETVSTAASVAASPGWLEGVNAWLYSHSYGNVQASPNINCFTAELYRNRLLRRLGLNSLTARSYNGYWMQDVAAKMLSGADAWVPARGLILIDGVQNDMRNGGASDTQALGGFTDALRAMCWLAMADQRIEETNGAFSYTGTWTSVADTTGAAYSGGTLNRSIVGGSTWSITQTATDLVVLTNGQSASTPGTTTIAVDGVQKAVVNHASRAQTSTGGLKTGTPIAVPLRGLGGGAHTVVGTKDGGTGSVYIDALLTMSPTPPTVVVLKQLYLPSYTVNGSDAAVAAYNAAIDTVVAELQAAGKPVVACDPNVGYDKANGFINLHPNSKGMSQITDQLVSTLAGLGFHDGLNFVAVGA